MRKYALVLAAVCLSFATAAEARPKQHANSRKRVAVDRDVRVEKKQRADKAPRERDRSVGAPWAGRLVAPARLRGGERYVIRRPWRSYGTRTTIELVHDAITNTLDAFPKVHVLGIGDISAESGGQITDHHSHQSGRDADIGLFYKKQPANYPASFVRATESNLDCAATWRLIWELAKTSTIDGGAQVMFLDYNVQGILYRWGKQHGVSEARLDRVFEYPHGRGSGNGIVHHFPNHDNHVHVRFKCRDRDTACR